MALPLLLLFGAIGSRAATAVPQHDVYALSPKTGQLEQTLAATYAASDPRYAVSAAVIDGHGGWFISGNFSSLGGVRCAGFAHITVDFQVDRHWCSRFYGVVDALYLHGHTLYVGGEFTRVGGAVRPGLAAFDLPTGRLLPWRPQLRTELILSIAFRGHAIYIAGFFRPQRGTTTRYLGALDATTGGLLPWNPAPDTGAHGDSASWVVATPGTILVSGQFFHVGGAARPSGFAALSPSTGR